MHRKGTDGTRGTIVGENRNNLTFCHFFLFSRPGICRLYIYMCLCDYIYFQQMNREDFKI